MGHVGPYEWAPRGHSVEKVAYIHQMLGELRQVAFAEGADMLCYRIEMVYVEAGDIQSGRRPQSFVKRDENKPAGMPV
ncbi:hypothetical protein FHP24_02480 [Aliirhizobium smilacinae]|uniref:Uncharacterized protein n=1 Tax=Aliirhizobium smilacinae TaxID=1395944 RepID=A0A5C4XNP3_9HYPH|nr:hypothetical protein FHP24_02480 [Rhizobium smilacinae]